MRQLAPASDIRPIHLKKPASTPGAMRFPRLLPVLLASALPAAVAVAYPADQAQIPMMPPSPPTKQPAEDKDSSPASSSSSSVPLADILGTNRALTSFSSFARMHASTSSLLADRSARVVVLAPLNSAIEALPRKPWEDPRDYDALGEQAYDGAGGESRADANLRRFVEAHIVRAGPWREGEKAPTVAGRQIWYADQKSGKRVILPDGIEVEKVASTVANGEVFYVDSLVPRGDTRLTVFPFRQWTLKGVLNYK
ncbi:LOW QUALITY PROTEIN: FAS1 domain-containing protein precursor [Purpureocillium lavendulum]|uniref:FAS1 domain-containing protein n=1 Tax=Purpureocillium lavendulum TaxID=1247861 RepID=A0AB34FTN5_9HYPO|nr:LOW QUALITY PROTEIN: FAS1 domain-containing protein precursor [Purpureocillium lavendulum]